MLTGHTLTKYNTGRWTSEEHAKFLYALQIYGKEWKKVQEYVGTRTSTQARSHAQKFFYKLDKNSNVTPSFKEDLTRSPKKKPKLSFSEHPTPIVDRALPEVFKVSNDPFKKENDSSVKVVLDISQFNFPVTHSSRRLTFGGEDLHKCHIDGIALSTCVSNEEPMIEDDSLLKCNDLFPERYSMNADNDYGFKD
jgi:SHAQKYF class myb-like DNA-binding protein